MTGNALVVLMGESLAGVVTRSQGSLQFVYDEGYRRLPAATPLSVSMPTDRAVHADQVVARWMAGLLPDNDRVLSRWARTFQVANSPFALLGTPVGEDCAGAVRFVTEDGLEAALPCPPQRQIAGGIAQRFPAPIPPTAGLLRDAYSDIGLSSAHIEMLTGQPHEQILDALRQHDIQVRPLSRFSPWPDLGHFRRYEGSAFERLTGRGLVAHVRGLPSRFGSSAPQSQLEAPGVFRAYERWLGCARTVGRGMWSGYRVRGVVPAAADSDL